MSADAHPFLLRLQQATNDHNLDALVDCFAPDYRNDAPAHPGRAFEGTEQVRRNWRQIFGFVPDIRSRVLNHAVHGSEVWSEWEMSGTRVDGTQHLMRGVIVFGLQGSRAVSARFYLEPVDEANTTVDDAVRAQVHADNPT
ncbi:MAG: nuclear transport factor 2 family protein [Pseudonocardiales bacterium]|nr:MAG: nuclear transport factor 2 family protein [Pseudonocardiales bacterium]